MLYALNAGNQQKRIGKPAPTAAKNCKSKIGDVS